MKSDEPAFGPDDSRRDGTRTVSTLRIDFWVDGSNSRIETMPSLPNSIRQGALSQGE